MPAKVSLSELCCSGLSDAGEAMEHRAAGIISSKPSNSHPQPILSGAARRVGSVAKAGLGNLGPLDEHDVSLVRGEDGLSYLALQLEAGTLRPECVPSRIST